MIQPCQEEEFFILNRINKCSKGRSKQPEDTMYERLELVVLGTN